MMNLLKPKQWDGLAGNQDDIFLLEDDSYSLQLKTAWLEIMWKWMNIYV